MCFECGEEGHFKNDYPKKKGDAKPNVKLKPKERAVQINLEETNKEVDTALGAFLVNYFTANILFDLRANYYFVSHKFGKILALPLCKLETTLLVEVSGKIIHVSDCMKNIFINLNGNRFHGELLPIEFNGVDVVLGMD